MKQIPTERKWYYCPHCGAKVLLYDNSSESHGVYCICNRGCRNEIEITIENGKQVFPEQPAGHSSR